MTDTQKYALVMLSLGFIQTNVSYTTSQLYSIYLNHQSAVDYVFADSTRLSNAISTYQPQLPQIIIMDPNQNWWP